MISKYLVTIIAHLCKESKKKFIPFLWIKPLANFVTGWENDLEAVENAVSSPLSNGFVERTNSKLKMVKRTMYVTVDAVDCFWKPN